jgi:anaerobic selenocysteine-containing dehydrogenase
MAGDERAGKRKFSRRDFMADGGTVLAAGALAAGAAPAFAADAAKTAKNEYPFQRYLVYDTAAARVQSCMLFSLMS